MKDLDRQVAMNQGVAQTKKTAGRLNLTESLIFNAGRLIERDEQGETIDSSNDFSLTIPELISNCETYLNQYDQICADYLKGICSKLPVKLGDIEYSVFEY